MNFFLEETTDGECWSGPQKPTFIQKIKMLKHWRNPCKKCIVQACCGSACPKFLEHNKYKFFWSDWWIDGFILIASILFVLNILNLLGTLFIKLF